MAGGAEQLCSHTQNLKALRSCCLFPTMVRQLVDMVTSWNRTQGGMGMSLAALTELPASVKLSRTQELKGTRSIEPCKLDAC